MTTSNNGLPNSSGGFIVTIDAITSSHPISKLDTQDYFDTGYTEDKRSPIDQFISNSNELNKLFAVKEVDPVKANLIFLGYMSAVESYIRAVVRRVINIDEVARKRVEPQTVTFGAAIHHKVDMMPEALLEHISLAGEVSIKEVLKKLLGISGGLPLELKVPLQEYKKICELRHCVVHRFGKLGAKNAIALGLDKHNTLLEKPLAMNESSLNEIAATLRAFVKSFNNYVFRSLLVRMAKNKDENNLSLYAETWTWNYIRDKKRFRKYYDVFSSLEDTTVSADMKPLYDDYRSRYRV